VVAAGGIAELHALITNIIPRVDKVVQTETFVLTRSAKKRISMPQGMKAWQEGCIEESCFDDP